MALTWTENQQKFQTIAGDFTDTTLTQAKQDMNIGYARFNAALSRYFSRKQQFTDVISGQSIYQTPIDCIRVIGMTVFVSNTYQVTVKEIRSEFEWRTIKAYPYSSNWPAYYFMLGNDELEVWPTASQDVTNGLRFYYQQQSYDLSIEDITSASTSATVTVTNGSTLVTATSGIFTPNMKSLRFQLTGVNDLSWYEIVDVPTSSTLTLKSSFVGNSGSGQSFRIGQFFIFPDEYSDVPIDYALGRYFQMKNNPGRAKQYLNSDPNNMGSYDAAVADAIEKYSSSTEGNVIFNDGAYVNSWFLTPLPPTGQ